jgi:hypothetical protein
MGAEKDNKYLSTTLESIWNTMKDKMTAFEWTPLVSVGLLKFGESLDSIIHEFDLHKLDKPFEEFELDSYEFPNDDKRVYTEDGNIVYVACFDSLYYKGGNLVGLTLDEIRVLFGEEDKIGESTIFDFEGDEYEEIPVEFYGYGLEIWIRDEVVQSAIVSA